MKPLASGLWPLACLLLLLSAAPCRGQDQVLTRLDWGNDPVNDTIGSVSVVGTVLGNLNGSVLGNVDGNIGGNLAGFVGGVTGNVGGSVGGVSGNVTGSVGSIADNGITAASISSNAITAAKIAADAITDAKVASDVTIASVTGAVGSVTGNVGGNVTGSVGSISGVTFPTNFANLAINGSGHISRVTLTDTTTTNTDMLTQANVRSAIGLASANLDTQLSAASAKLDTIDDFLDSEVAAILAIADKLNSALELDGSVYRFTVNALEQAPAGGGGSATVENQELILARLSGSTVNVLAPVLTARQLSLVQGDSYHDADGRALRWTIPNYSGPDVDGATLQLRVGTATTASLVASGSVEVSGTSLVAEVELTSEQTQTLTRNDSLFQLVVTLDNGHAYTIVRGQAAVAPMITVP